MKLKKLHVLQGNAAPQQNGLAVPGVGVGIGSDTEHAARAAVGEENRLGFEEQEFSGRQVIGRHACAAAVFQENIQNLDLVMEVHLILDALLVERLEDHVSGPIGGIAGPTHRRLTEVTGVSPEPALVDPALRRTAERQAAVLEVIDRLNGLFSQDNGRFLIGEVITAFYGIEGVPFRLILLHIPQRRTDPALRRPGVRAHRMQLGQHRGAASPAGFQGCIQAGASGSDDDGVICFDGRHFPSHESQKHHIGKVRPCQATDRSQLKFGATIGLGAF